MAGQQVTAAGVVAEARTWIGVPWRHQGRSRLGVDCGGVVVCVGRELGLMDPRDDLKGYSVLPQPDVLAAVCRRLLRVKAGRPAPGDVVLMRPVMSQRWPSHLGIVTDMGGALGMVHAYGCPADGGSVRESRFGPWSGRVVATFTYGGLA